MGCFSFICQKSNEPILSNSLFGDGVHLFLLKNGKVIEHMYGNYDSYGRVFKNVKDQNDKSLTKYSSFEWNMPWNEVVNLICSSNRSNGIAAILSPFWEKGDPYPKKRSKNDPNQGRGKHFKLEISILKYIQKDIKNPYHKIF